MKKLAAFLALFEIWNLKFGAHQIIAHEAYVLTPQEFHRGLSIPTTHAFEPLLDPSHIQVFLIITFFVCLSYGLVLFFATTNLAKRLDKNIKKLRAVGPYIVRLALSASFFYAAMSNCDLGPELSLSNFAGGEIIRTALFLIAFMIFFGIYVEVAALVGLGIFFYVSTHYGLYLITYANYFGELLVLCMFGSRFFSFDKLFFGKELLFSGFIKYTHLEIPIVRVLYGAALMFAGYTIKFQHQILSVWVYNEYHLQNYFHASANFIAAGAGASEILIGLFIVLGFAMRWTIFLSLIFITLSLLYFKELIWPHFMLYGISFSLLINSADKFTIDYYLVPWLRRFMGKFF